MTALIVLFGALETSAIAQSGTNDIYWHIDPTVKECSMVIDPALTQAEWKRFVTQVGPLTSFKTLSDAVPLGTMNFRVGLDQGQTPIDQQDRAWINTFTHPDEECPLGEVISYPTLRARVGVSDRVDVGAYWTTAPRANYGMIGAEVMYAFQTEEEDQIAAAVRGSGTFLTGVDDFSLSIYSLEVLASKRVWRVAPYAGIRGNLTVGSETTAKVALSREVIPTVQGFIGVSAPVWVLSLAAEYNISSVNTFSFTLGFNF